MVSGGKRSNAGRKPGTPNKEKKPNARGKVLHIRLSDAEHDGAALCADSLGESMSDFVREAIRLRYSGDSAVVAEALLQAHSKHYPKAYHVGCEPCAIAMRCKKTR